MTNEILTLVGGAAMALASTSEGPQIFWASDPIRPGETLMIQGHAFHADVVVEVSPGHGKAMQKIEILDQSTQCLKALIPAHWKPDVYTLKISTAAGEAKALLNRPADIWWVGDQGDRQTPGAQFRLSGRNMSGDPAAVRLRLTGPHAVDVPVDKAQPYTLTATLPATVAPGEYMLQAHNGWGDEAGWSEPVALHVAASPAPWPTNVFNVMDFGAGGRGETDDTAAVQAALAQAATHGGGVVFFPRGIYELRDTLTVPRFTVLRGAKREWVELLWPNQPEPIVLVRGSNSFGVEDLTLSAFNYLDGIVSDGGWLKESGDVFLRRLRVRALRYSRVSFDEFVKRFLEQAPRCGGTTLLVGGRNIEITDCDIYGSGMSLHLTGVRGGRVSGNRFYNGPYGWYSLTGMEGLLFENNEVIGASMVAAGGSLNTFFNAHTGSWNMYFANNKMRTIFGSDREATSSDGGGGNHTGHIVSSDGVNLVLSDGPQLVEDIWYKEAKPGMGVYILDGRGAGQWRRVIRQEGRTVILDAPWDVDPDETSIVSISVFQGNYYLIDNDYSDSTCAIQMFGISIGHVMAGNTSTRAGGFHVWGLCYGSIQPSWYCQMLDNEILEGNGILDACNGIVPRGSHIAALGPETNGFRKPLVRAAVIRGNHLHNNASIELKGYVSDIVVEHNTIENSDVGVNVESTVIGALVRENTFRNVDQTMLPKKDSD